MIFAKKKKKISKNIIIECYPHPGRSIFINYFHLLRYAETVFRISTSEYEVKMHKCFVKLQV